MPCSTARVGSRDCDFGYYWYKCIFSFPTSCFLLTFPSSDHMHTHIWSHQISLLALVALSCFIFSPLHALALSPLLLTWLFSSQLEVIFVSPILNTQTYKTFFSHSCLSIYSWWPFNCECHEGSDELVTWSFSLHCGPFKPSSKDFSLVFFARFRNERTSSS